MERNVATAQQDVPLYRQIADRMADLVERGTYRVGDRLPSVRELSRDWKVSITTVTEAYQLLENRGVVEARPQSGHYVRVRAATKASLNAPRPAAPSEVSMRHLAMMVVGDFANSKLLQLGVGALNPELIPTRKLHQAMTAACRRHGAMGTSYEFVPGLPALRSEIARRLVSSGCAIGPEEVTITSGTQEAVSLALTALCKPGDAVALESPAYFGFLQLFETLGLRALEIPADPVSGVSLEALRFAIEEHRPAAVLSNGTFNNPQGFLMPEDRRQALVELCAERGVPLIEDDIYGELGFGPDRPRTCKSFDRADGVILAGSVSKTLAPGYRVGWVVGGRWHEEITTRKAQTSLATATPTQCAVAEFLATGGYDHHLRRLRRAHEQRVRWLADAVRAHFPAGTEVRMPAGGFVLWVSLPGRVDSLALYERARTVGVTISPGVLFSARDRFRSHIRLNAAFAGEECRDRIARLGAEAEQLVG